MGRFEDQERRMQNRSDRAREEQRDLLWRTQCVPRFVDQGLTPEQIDVARKMFIAGFDAGWESHQAFLMSEFIRENQKQKVHLA